ncbi:BnaC06g04140D [Brassica napus]|uniref:(rape) hypothetical protein n=1 Tax=Brassica napus TaxID=3708 RepID=A0A078GIU1_BRANA|nr:uncharacterized protein LOC106406286 isoform X1 [Brassica napus]XP_048637772.1 uncharacterized protein LOC106406286 isoform X1 [Brassica napus]CAF2081463.1 unnamed protein product [Brassica napus]CDY25189.1 BnaC06g04140D [Brassica napus]
MGDDIQAKALEEKLKSQLRLLELEHAVFERMVYKNKNQHRRCSYFQYLLKVRRDLRLLRTANMVEILRPCFHVIAGTGTKQKLHVLESLKLKKSPSILDRLRGALHLLSQMTEPILKAASGISVLLACSFFIGSSMTFLALLARLRVLIQQILLDAVSVFNSVTSTSLKKQSVKIAQDGVEVFREFYPKDEGCFTLLDCVWKTDKYVLLETLQNRESSKPLEENVSQDATTRDSLVQYQTSGSSLGEDLSLLPEADNGGVTVTESSTPIAETASSKTNNALQPEVSDKPEDATTRDCSVQYETFVSPLGEDLSPLPEADTVGVTVIESSTPIAETASSKTNSALQPEDATTRGCSIQYETSISPLGEDMSHPLPEADKDGGATVTESSTPIAEAASSKTNNGSQTEDLEKPDDESTKPPSPAKINTNTTKPSCRATKVAFLPVKRPFAAITPNPIEEPPRKKQETGEKDKKEAEEEDGFYNLLIRGTHKDSLF